MEQLMKLGGKTRRLFIETPLGIIEIERIDSHQLRITGPDGIMVHRSEERALNSGKFVARTADGKLVPKYQMLVPRIDEQGALAGVDQPPVYRAPRLATA